MYENEQKKYRLPKYLALTQVGKISVINYYETLEDLKNNLEFGKVTTVYERNGAEGKWWEYFADISKGIYND